MGQEWTVNRMTLDKAIAYCEEVAERCATTDGDLKCEMNHRQFAEWLKELRMRRVSSADVVKVVRCKDCKWFNKIGCAIEIVDEFDKPHEDDFCSFAERRTDGEQNGSID